jgi:thiol-disulfide isomerase/thioredoxin
MDCYTTWCGPCKGLAKDIFPQKKVGDYFNSNFINVTYDMEKGDGKMLNAKYKKYIIGYPTMLLINSEGEVIHQMAGYQEADVLIEGMKAGSGGYSLAATEAKYNAGARDLPSVVAYVNALNGAFKKDIVQNVINEYLTIIPVDSLTNPEIWNLVGKFIKDPYSEPYKFVFNNIERKFQYQLKVNRYELESQLGYGMGSAVSEIIKISQKTTNADTLRLLKAQTDSLMPMLTQSTIKRFPAFAAKLYLNTLRLEQKPVEMYQTMSYFNTIRLVSDEKIFVGDCYRYILENTKDKKIIQSILESALAYQDNQKKPYGAFSYNFYDVISLAYTKLGKKAEAAKASAEYDNLVTLRDKYFHEIFAKRDKKEADKEDNNNKVILE